MAYAHLLIFNRPSCGASPARPGRRARTRQPENSKRAHFRALQTPPKLHEKTPRETQKERNGGGRGKKKREILGPHPSGAPPFGQSRNWPKSVASGGLKWCRGVWIQSVVDKTIQTLRASVSVKRVRRSVKKSSRAHQVPQSMSWTPYQRCISVVGWRCLGASFCKETICNEISPQVLARSVQNRVIALTAVSEGIDRETSHAKKEGGNFCCYFHGCCSIGHHGEG